MRSLTLAAVTGGFLVLGVPALAQSVDELVVTGHRHASPDTVSKAVSFADVNLTKSADRDVLKARISTTARQLCDQLNEPPPSPNNLGRSCRDVAVREATAKVKTAVHAAYAHHKPPAHSHPG